MAFDSDTRNKLSRMVAQTRQLLTDEFTQQLQEIYGIQPDGTIADVEKLTHLDDEEAGIAKFLRERIGHLVSGMTTEKKPVVAAIDRVVREQAFTILNRFAALRMCEERSLVEECVRAGMQSKGFKVYITIAGSGLGDIYERYKTFLFCLFDEIAVDLGVLFDRFSPQGLLFPREQALLGLLTIINNDDLSKLWAEDETIGWIYQYFNPPDERRAMREASQAPRNSRELAVRNQFFTPRYVVEFLTDNTLGRIWYEMRRGDTALKEECRYLVRRPKEVFLAMGEKAPTELDDETDLSQEELLKKPVHIEHRPKKDPRNLSVLDPACGSGHFLLYTFDLLERIYEQAWEDPESPKSEITGRTLREEFETLEELRRAAPKLIIEHNLHGIDIDPRAVQIAAFALWLRAQKTWKSLGIKAAERPLIQRSNIVTAEPMPGEEDMRREFTAGLKPRVLGQLVDVVFDKMKLAGEAGSLLKIEEEIKDTVAEARKQWLGGPKMEQAVLFPEMVKPKPEQQQLRFDLTGVTDKRFWEQAEDCILDALEDYAEQAENVHAIRYRLFAEDAARGFAFIDLCRKRYDVVLMNPPFGEASKRIKRYVELNFRSGKSDLGAAFVQRGSRILQDKGRVGAITNRTMLAVQRFSNWRREIVERAKLFTLADLGHGVLDAMVETAMYVCGNTSNDQIVGRSVASFIGLLDVSNKESQLLYYLQNVGAIRWCKTFEFDYVPGGPWAYWVPSSLLRRFRADNSFSGRGGLVCQGPASADDFRFYRLRWEVPASQIHVAPHLSDESFAKHRWSPVAKGGEYSLWWDDIHLVVEWAKDGAIIKAYIAQQYPYLNGNWGWVAKNTDKLFRRGSTYPYRTTSAFGLRLLPAGVSFSVGGWAVFAPDNWSDEHVLATFNTRIARYLMEVLLGQGDSSESGTAARNYVAAAVGGILWPAHPPEGVIEKVKELIDQAALWTTDETAIFFSGSRLFKYDSDTLNTMIKTWWNRQCDIWLKTAELYNFVETAVISVYDLKPEEMVALTESEGPSLYTFPMRELEVDTVAVLFQESVEQLTERAKQACGSKRYTVKKAYFVERCIDLASHILQVHPFSVIEAAKSAGPVACGAARNFCVSFIGWIVGLAVGRFAVKDKQDTVEPSALPHLALRGIDEGDTILDIWVDDPGSNDAQPHRDDIVRRVREVLDLFWKDNAHEIEQEACDFLGARSLRDYFRKPLGFFQDHLKRYSKSRRKAPIYWPLSTKSGSYTLWIYYHRLTNQTLYACVNDYVIPKLNNILKDIVRLQEEVAKQGSIKNRQRLEQLMDFERELKDFRDELLRLAGLPYKPNLNDGVMITAAPLWNLFRHNQWRKDLEACWEKLKESEYDWAHLAYAIWPDRVKEKCKTDLSIAIVHDLEDLYEGVDTKPKRGRGKGKSLE